MKNDKKFNIAEYSDIANGINDFKGNDFENYGYSVFGPLLFGFVRWIDEEAIQAKADCILFLARDGYVMQKAYEQLESPMKFDYLYVSRRSLTVPLLTGADSMRDVLKIVPYIKREETMAQFLGKLGIESREIEDRITEQFGETIKRSDLYTQMGDALYREIEDVMKENALEEFRNASAYLKPYFENKKVALVDLGWYGTIQNSIEILLKKTGCKTELLGLYIGKLFREDNAYKENMKGYVFDFHEKNRKQSIVYGYNGLIESFFTANHGSVKKYTDDGKPVLEQYEAENEERINELHQGALQFVCDILLKEQQGGIPPQRAFYHANRLFTKPNKQEVKMFGELVFYDKYYERLVPFRGYKYYLRHPKAIIGDFMVSNWKIGFIRKATGILPAERIYMFMMKWKG